MINCILRFFGRIIKIGLWSSFVFGKCAIILIDVIVKLTFTQLVRMTLNLPILFITARMYNNSILPILIIINWFLISITIDLIEHYIHKVLIIFAIFFFLNLKNFKALWLFALIHVAIIIHEIKHLNRVVIIYR